jgi:hypothetical protein
MRKAKDNDFFVELPDVGVFRFGRRTFADRVEIRSNVMRITKELTGFDLTLDGYASIMAAHKVLCVEAPAGWEDISAIELDDDSDEKILELYDLLRAKEELFRKGSKEGGEGSGQEPVGDVPVLVSETIQPST